MASSFEQPSQALDELKEVLPPLTQASSGADTAEANKIYLDQNLSKQMPADFLSSDGGDFQIIGDNGKPVSGMDASGGKSAGSPEMIPRSPGNTEHPPDGGAPKTLATDSPSMSNVSDNTRVPDPFHLPGMPENSTAVDNPTTPGGGLDLAGMQQDIGFGQQMASSDVLNIIQDALKNPGALLKDIGLLQQDLNTLVHNLYEDLSNGPIDTRANGLLHFGQGTDPRNNEQLVRTLEHLPTSTINAALKYNPQIDIEAGSTVPLSGYSAGVLGYFSEPGDLGHPAGVGDQVVVAGGAACAEEALAHEMFHVQDQTQTGVPGILTNQTAIQIAQQELDALPSNHRPNPQYFVDGPQITDSQGTQYGLGDIEAEIVAGLDGAGQSSLPGIAMSDFPELTNYLEQKIIG